MPQIIPGGFFTSLHGSEFLLLCSGAENSAGLNQVHVNTLLCMCSHTCACAHTQVPNCILFFCYYSLGPLPFHTWTHTASPWGVNFPGGCALLCLKLLRISICFYLPCGCEDHAWPMGALLVPRGCGVLSAREVCLAFFPFGSFHSLLFVCGLPRPSVLDRNTLLYLLPTAPF